MKSVLDRVVAGPGPVEQAVAVPRSRAIVLATAAPPELVAPSPLAPSPAMPVAPAPIAAPVHAAPVARDAPLAPPITAPEPPRRTSPPPTPPPPRDRPTPAPRVQPITPATVSEPAQVVHSIASPRTPAAPREPAPVTERVVERVTPAPVVIRPPAVETRELVHVVERRTLERVVEAAPSSEKPVMPPRPASVREAAPLVPATPAPVVIREPAAPPAPSPPPPVATVTREEPRTITIVRTVPKPKKVKAKKPLLAAPAVVRPVASRAAPPATRAPAVARAAPRIEIQIGTIEIKSIAPARRSEPARITPRHHTVTFDGDR
jgi:hypothetical protein